MSYEFPQVFIPCIPILAEITIYRHAKEYRGEHTRTQASVIILLHPSVIDNFLLDWFGTWRLEGEMEDGEASHAE